MSETPKVKKQRDWVFTLNNYTEAEEHALQELECVYIVYGHEKAPTTGTPHLQGYVYFPNALGFNGVQKRIPRARIAAARGNSLENYNYCSKDNDNVYERGTRPLTQEEKGVCEKRRWQEIIQHAKDGDHDWLEENEPEVAFKHAKIVEYFEKKHAPKLENLPERKVHWWLWGVAHSGKSWDARHNPDGSEKSYYSKELDKWWCTYNNQEVVVIDEFEPHHAQFFSHLLKKWADVYPFTAQTKGGSKVIRPKQIFITSNYKMEECFADTKILDALKTRFNVKHYPFVYKPPN